MSIPITDTHQHFILNELWPYSWAEGIPALAGQRFGPEEYEIATAGTGITRTLFMETSPDDPHFHEETRHVRELAERPGSPIAGIIANCRPEEKDGFEAFLDSIAHPKLVGLRRILHVVPDELSTTDHFVSNINLLGKRGLTFDLCFLARQLPLAIDLVRKCEGVQFILDHCGVPDVAGQALDPWRDHIRQLATLPNIACKISGVLAYAAPDNATTEAVRPFVEHCIEQFGWDRVVWGGDWPVCNMTSSIAKWVEVSREIVAGASEENQAALFHRNAERIYQIP